MFTGIVTDVGTVRTIEQKGDTWIKIETSYDMNDVEIGASIACSGPCLTVIEKGSGWFAVEASAETLNKTALGDWVAGTRVNLERAMRIGDELGGHIVSGHVDAVAVIVGMQSEGDSVRFTLEMPGDFSKYIAPKGSVCLDGVSLTVNEVQGNCFGVNIISHTQSATSFSGRKVGDRINLEIDTIARYVARLLGKE
ncbi:MAG: riboflavin synthase [Pseudomonadota bacterium]|nr:riboflavin synthase [Pseudomonadota bacterium]MEC8462426.1 riboflavin synthase [Pseudomonadota bacterium]MEC8531600.1 riboflavin synthase [Pseudomonadota bacterium]MEC8726139.1 riboflavin synthase [Pseudomonadota bacterium]|tara:strand:+ start:489 stop:1076 length:588 start_codon:yes stop_codon:yes gene_type:complete